MTTATVPDRYNVPAQIKQESRITPALSSMYPQIHTPISAYTIQQASKKCKFYIKFFKMFILDAKSG